MMNRNRAGRVLAPGLLAALTLLSNCEKPLSPETPKTEVDEPAPLVDVEVTSTQDLAPPSKEQQAKSPGKLVYKGVGLKTPESVVYHAAADLYLVSNINGSPVGVDNNGFISQLSPTGEVMKLDFIAGGQKGVELNAPKGMLILGTTLYVTDLNHVRKFDVNTGAAQGAVHFPKATFLNKLASDEKGVIYVSDSGRKAGEKGLEPNGSDAIYRLEGETITVVAEGKQLQGPNGVTVVGDAVLMVTFGSNLLWAFGPDGTPGKQAKLPTGGLDGLVPLKDGSLLISSWQGKAVYRGTFDAPFVPVVSGAESPADIGFDPKRGRILVPLFVKDEVWAVPLKDAPAGATAPAKPAVETPANTQPAAKKPSPDKAPAPTEPGPPAKGAQ